MASGNLFEELTWRGLVHPPVDGDLPEHLASNRVTAYCGFDPTADSLHLGNFLLISNLKRLLDFGHQPIILIGGGTGMVGDPGGKSAERNLLDVETLRSNAESIRKQLSSFFDTEIEEFDSPKAKKAPVLIADNAAWLSKLNYIDFLRDFGKNFSVNAMIAKDSVKRRLETAEQTLSYTEFSYQLLQAYDFLQLHDTTGCTLQIGGSDQWGNIAEGASIIRRLRSTKAFGLVSPLVTKADGTKYGKSVGGAIWLDANKTSPFQMHQFLLQSEDSKVIEYLKFFTWLSQAEIDDLAAQHEADAGKRVAHRCLADEVVALVHGRDEVDGANAAAAALFSEDIAGLDEKTLLGALSDVPSIDLATGITLLEAITSAFEKSKSAANIALGQGGIYVNNLRSQDGTQVLGREVSLHGKYIVLRWGKRDVRLATLQG